MAYLHVTQIHSERRILVAHQRDVDGHPIAPSDDAHQKVEHALVDRADAQQPHRVDDAQRLQKWLQRPAENYLWQSEQPALQQHSPIRTAFWIIHLEVSRVIRYRGERERRVLVGAVHGEAVIHQSPRPTQDPDIEIEERTWIP